MEAHMKVTIVGAGNMGFALASQLTRAGHRVTVTSRNPEKGREVARTVGATFEDKASAKDVDVVIVATGYGDAVEALRNVGDLEGKVVVDITNPLTPDYMGLAIGHDTSAAEEIQKAFPAAKVVKAFNTVFAQVLGDGPALAGATVPVFYAGNDPEAKETVAALIRSIGFTAVDAGGLPNARYLEPVAGLNIYLGYGAGRGTAIAPAWIGVR
jgi:NADPH-dependent F420 reductase